MGDLGQVSESGTITGITDRPLDLESSMKEDLPASIPLSE